MPEAASTGTTPNPAFKEPGHQIYDEFFTTQENLANKMIALNNALKELRPILQETLSAAEVTTLENYLKPYQDLTVNPYPRGEQYATLSVLEKAKLIQSQINSPEANAVNKASVISLNAVGKAGDDFFKLIREKIIKARISNPDKPTPEDIKLLQNINIALSRDYLARPYQNVMRYETLSGAMKDLLNKWNEKLSDADKTSAKDVFNDISSVLGDVRQQTIKVAQGMQEKVRERELLEITDGLKEYPGKNKKLNQLIADVSKESGGEKRFALISKAFVDAYLDERTATVVGTIQKSAFLLALEKTFANAIGKYTNDKQGDTKNDAYIFRNLTLSSHVKELTAHLFERANVAVKENQEQVYVNTVKAVMRIGTVAVDEWNKLIIAQNAEKLKIPTEKFPTEDIRAAFKNIHAAVVKPKIEEPDVASQTRKDYSPSSSRRPSFSSNSPPATPRNLQDTTSSVLSSTVTNTPLLPSSRFIHGIISEENINKIKPVLASNGWTLHDVKTVDNAAMREVTKAVTENGEQKQKQFSIGAREMKTQDTDLETFVTMLKCFEQTHHKMPTITTANEKLKETWVAACKQAFPDKNVDFDKVITVKGAKALEPTPDVTPEPTRSPHRP